jgi:tRNA 2-thiouridine synthesizing protein A
MPLAAGSEASESADSAIGTAMAETLLDLKGLKCPLPALKTRKALSRLAAGDELVVECTDPLAGIDIPNLLRETGDALLDTRKKSSLIVFRIKKK